MQILGVGRSATGRPGRQNKQNGNPREAIVIHRAKSERHCPGSNPVDGGYQAKKRGGKLSGWSIHTHVHDEGARVGPQPQALLKHHVERKVDMAVNGHQVVQHAPNLDGSRRVNIQQGLADYAADPLGKVQEGFGHNVLRHLPGRGDDE